MTGASIESLRRSGKHVSSKVRIPFSGARLAARINGKEVNQ